MNAKGGILGKKIDVVQEDGQSEPTVFAEKINKLLTQDEVEAVFGGWTSASRKAMLPVVEGANGLLFYPVQYEGLEASKNIYYTGATTNQQIIPAMDFLKSKGVKTLFLAGSDYVFPRTANKIIKQYAKELGIQTGIFTPEQADQFRYHFKAGWAGFLSSAAVSARPPREVSSKIGTVLPLARISRQTFMPSFLGKVISSKIASYS